MAINPVPPIGPLQPDPHQRPGEEPKPKGLIQRVRSVIYGLFAGSGRYDENGKMKQDDEPGQHIDTRV